MTNKLKFRVVYIPPGIYIEVNKMLSNLDLGINGIFKEEEYILLTRSKITKKYIDKVTKLINQAIVEVGGEPQKVNLIEISKNYE